MGAASLEPGSLFANDFEIVRPLSAGGMGSVYVALQKSTGKQRALKLMLAQLVANPDLRRRFHQEARIASMIKSEHVVEVVGAGVDEASGAPWLAMELLEGMDLDTAIRSRGPMTLREARGVLEELCHAVSAAHDAGIIHRDLKPENIFLAASRRAQEASVVKVLDFGIARIAAEASTKHTGAMGSPIWMAPEQTERGEVTPAADVWALGLIAFFVLTGQPFWLSAGDPDGSVQQIMREVLFEPIPKASERARRFGADQLLPRWFDAWFARCVVRDPTQRLPHASAAFSLFAGLESGRASSSMPIASSPDSSAKVVVTSERRMQQAGVTSTGPTAYAGSELPRVVARPTTMVVPRDLAPEPAIRPGFVIAALLVVAVVVFAVFGLHLFRDDELASPSKPPQVFARGPQTPPLPPELASTPGAMWFAGVRGRCNPVEAEVVIQQSPPPQTTDGAGFAAACFVLAGRVERARSTLLALPADERTRGSWPVFEVVHPIADAGDDASAGPAMRLVLEFWPDNYMALYHAGMSEYRTGQRHAAADHLRRFLQIYDKPDGFTAAARHAVAELAHRPSSAPDCSAPLIVDPEGRKVFRLGCDAQR